MSMERMHWPYDRWVSSLLRAQSSFVVFCQNCEQIVMWVLDCVLIGCYCNCDANLFSANIGSVYFLFDELYQTRLVSWRVMENLLHLPFLPKLLPVTSVKFGELM